MRDSRVIQVIAGLVTLGAVTAMVITLRGGLPAGIESRPHEAAGWAMARETLARLKPGGQVLLIVRDTTEFKNPATDLQLARFKRELRKAKTSITAVETLRVDPLRPAAVPSEDFMRWIRKTPSGSVIVSFMGPPILSPAQRKQLGTIQPAIVAFCPGNLPDRVNLRALFDQGLLHAAILSRQRPPPAPSKPQNLQAWFDRSFMVATSADLDAALVARDSRTALNSP